MAKTTESKQTKEWLTQGEKQEQPSGERAGHHALSKERQRPAFLFIYTVILRMRGVSLSLRAERD